MTGEPTVVVEPTGRPSDGSPVEPTGGELAPVLDDVRAALAEAAGYVDGICCGVGTVLAAAPLGRGAAAEAERVRRAATATGPR